MGKLGQIIFQIRSGKISILSNPVGERKYYVLLSHKDFYDIGLAPESSDETEMSVELRILYAMHILGDEKREWFRDPADFETLYYVLENWERDWLGNFPRYTIFKWELEAIINNGNLRLPPNQAP